MSRSILAVACMETNVPLSCVQNTHVKNKPQSHFVVCKEENESNNMSFSSSSFQQPTSQTAADVQPGVPANLMPWKIQNIPSLVAPKQRMLLRDYAVMLLVFFWASIACRCFCGTVSLHIMKKLEREKKAQSELDGRLVSMIQDFCKV